MAQPHRPSRREEFEIAIICALPKERNAIEAVLDEDYEADGVSYGKAAGDLNAYTLGRIGNHPVVLAYMPGMGKISSAAVAVNIRSSFKGIRLCIVAGICGGATRTPHGDEILLGDIIVSESVKQIDFGRQMPNKFVPKNTTTDNLGRANPEIRAFLGRASGFLVRKRLLQKTELYTTKVLRDNDMRTFSYPGLKNDKLYSSHHRHKHHQPNSCFICNICKSQFDDVCEAALVTSCKDLGCDERELVPRDRAVEARKLKVHFGPIASGDGVIKSGPHRDEIMNNHGIIAFEMEGAGAWDYLPTVVIKSVCDYSDSHKNKAWQGYAAIAAAAFTKAILEEWRAEDKSQERPSLNLQNPVSLHEMCGSSPGYIPSRPLKRSAWLIEEGDGSDYSEQNRNNGVIGQHYTFSKETQLENFKPTGQQREENMHSELLETAKIHCLRSLSFPNMDSRQNNISLPHKNTCDWLFSTHQFQRWHKREQVDNYNGILWIKGKLGAGKSTLMKHMVQYYQKSFSNYVIAAYFFNSQGNNLEKSLLGMLQSLIYQLLDQCSSFQDLFMPVFLNEYKKHGDMLKWHPVVLKEFLFRAMEQWQKEPIVIIVDAIDECDEAQTRSVVSFLYDLAERAINSTSSLNICLSSRHYPGISIKKSIELVLEGQKEHDHDIETYVRDKLHVTDNDIEEELLRKAQGIFMWVIFVVETINRMYDDGRIAAIQKKLHEVPDDLVDMYRLLLEKENPYKRETMAMFQLLSHARETLTQVDLYVAIIAATDPERLELIIPWNGLIIPLETVKRFITSTSRGLVEVCSEGHEEGATRKAKFIHGSVADFLTQSNSLQALDLELFSDNSGASHNFIKKCCLSYIEMISRLNTVTNLSIFEQGDLYPFLSYAARGLFYHAEAAHSAGCPQHDFLHQLHHNSRISRALNKAADRFEQDINPKDSVVPELLYCLCYHACSGLLWTYLLNYSVDVNVMWGSHGSALQVAAMVTSKDHKALSIIRSLLNAGANINANGGKYGSALQVAALYDTEATEMLLHAGADVNIRGGLYETAIQAAAINNTETIQILLDSGAHVNIEGGKYGSALQAAAIYSTASVELLLSAGADVNIQGGLYGTALQAAAKYNTDAVKLLLDAGAEVNIQGGKYGTALQAAAKNGKEGIKMLLRAGADVNIQGGKYGTALQAAARYTPGAIKMLLDSGANANIKGGKYGTALQAATIFSTESLKMLLDAGVDVNAMGGLYGTALQAAAMNNIEAIPILLDAGAQVNIQSRHHKNASQVSVGTELRAEEATPFQEELHDNILQSSVHLIATCIIYTEANLLTWRMGYNHRLAIHKLLGCGADVNAEGRLYKNALHAAVQIFSETERVSWSTSAAKELIQMLLEAGVNVNPAREFFFHALENSAVNKKAAAFIPQMLLSN